MLEPQEKKHVSFSQFQCFHQCQHKYYLKYIKEIDLQQYSIDLPFGKTMHSIAQSNLYNEQIGFKDEFIKQLKEFIAKGLKVDKDKVSEYIAYGNNICKHIHLVKENIKRIINLSSENTLLVNEYELKESLTQEYDFSGYIDTLIKNDNKMLIIDYKTAKYWNLRKKLSDIEVIYQLALYKYFIKKQYELDSKNIKVCYILLLKDLKNEPVQLVNLSLGNKRVNDAYNTIIKMIEFIHNGMFRKSYNCKFCEYKGTEYCQDEKSIT